MIFLVAGWQVGTRSPTIVMNYVSAESYFKSRDALLLLPLYSG